MALAPTLDERAAALTVDAQAPAVTTAVTLPAAPAEVFALVTNACQWPRWHPATASVREAPDRPLLRGDSVVESIRAAGRSFDARWIVVECDTPRRWVIATDSPQGSAWIEYTLVLDDAGTRFTRRLRWRSHHAPWTWLDHSLTRWILARQSRQAMSNLAALFHVPGGTP
jgi:uncharacterized protein YndB with AHSA1/START domain